MSRPDKSERAAIQPVTHLYRLLQGHALIAVCARFIVVIKPQAWNRRYWTKVPPRYFGVVDAHPTSTGVWQAFGSSGRLVAAIDNFGLLFEMPVGLQRRLPFRSQNTISLARRFPSPRFTGAALEDDLHPGADERGGVGLGCVHGMDVDLEVGTEGNAMSKAKAVERFENAFVILPGPIRFQCWFRIERAC